MNQKLTQIFEEYVHEIYRYTYSFTYNKEATEDIVAETFKRLVEKQDIDEKLVKFWLLRVARNLAMDYLKKQNRLVNDEETLFEVPAKIDEETIVMQEQLATVLQSQLELLNPIFREVITLRVWEELTFSQIAEVVGSTEDAVKMRYHRGVEALEALVSDKYRSQVAGVLAGLATATIFIPSTQFISTFISANLVMGTTTAASTAGFMGWLAANKLLVTGVTVVTAGLVTTGAVAGPEIARSLQQSQQFSSLTSSFSTSSAPIATSTSSSNGIDPYAGWNVYSHYRVAEYSLRHPSKVKAIENTRDRSAVALYAENTKDFNHFEIFKYDVNLQPQGRTGFGAGNLEESDITITTRSGVKFSGTKSLFTAIVPNDPLLPNETYYHLENKDSGMVVEFGFLTNETGKYEPEMLKILDSFELGRKNPPTQKFVQQKVDYAVDAEYFNDKFPQYTAYLEAIVPIAAEVTYVESRETTAGNWVVNLGEAQLAIELSSEGMGQEGKSLGKVHTFDNLYLKDYKGNHTIYRKIYSAQNATYKYVMLYQATPVCNENTKPEACWMPYLYPRDNKVKLALDAKCEKVLSQAGLKTCDQVMQKIKLTSKMTAESPLLASTDFPDKCGIKDANLMEISVGLKMRYDSCIWKFSRTREDLPRSPGDFEGRLKMTATFKNLSDGGSLKFDFAYLGGIDGYLYCSNAIFTRINKNGSVGKLAESTVKGAKVYTVEYLTDVILPDIDPQPYEQARKEVLYPNYGGMAEKQDLPLDTVFNFCAGSLTVIQALADTKVRAYMTGTIRYLGPDYTSANELMDTVTYINL